MEGQRNAPSIGKTILAAIAAMQLAGCCNKECYDYGEDDTAGADTAGVDAGNECFDGVDNDGDGLKDNFDLACQGDGVDGYTKEGDDEAVVLGECEDGIDNDSDGYMDVNDAACWCYEDDGVTPEAYVPSRTENDPIGELCN